MSWWHHLRSRATQRGRKVKGRSPLAMGKLRPYERSRCAEHISQSGRVVSRSVVHAPPEVVMLSPQTLLSNASMA
jgi:hypothetical protein